MLPICVKPLYHPPFVNLHQGLIFKSMQHSKVDKFKKREMVVHLEMKYKYETKLEVNVSLVLDFVLYFVTV